jgi:hypothetical protein
MKPHTTLPNLKTALKNLVRFNLTCDPTDEDRPVVKAALRALRMRVLWLDKGNFRLVSK